MKLITSDDIFDFFYRLNLKGVGFLGSKLRFDSRARTRSSFNIQEGRTSNWWNIDEIRMRWNEKITGDSSRTYVDYVYKKYLQGLHDIKILSPGSGVSSNELRFAAYPEISEITCIDLAEKPLATAEKIAKENNFTNMKFIRGDINRMGFQDDSYDMVMFNSSLHHFKDVEKLLTGRIAKTLKPDGFLLIFEYVGPARLQWSEAQLKRINELLKTKVPKEYRTRFKSRFIKNHVSGPGILRMMISDPSEAIDSENIVPALRKGYTPLEEKELGGNILMILLKDIAHHFKAGDPKAMGILKDLIKAEDEFLETESSNNIFGIYRKNLS